VLFVYSLEQCRVVRRVELAEIRGGGAKEGVPVSFEANEEFVVIVRGFLHRI
jgi:hypothetical protein